MKEDILQIAINNNDTAWSYSNMIKSQNVWIFYSSNAAHKKHVARGVMTHFKKEEADSH